MQVFSRQRIVRHVDGEGPSCGEIWKQDERLLRLVLVLYLWIVYMIPIGFAYYGPAVLYPVMMSNCCFSPAELSAGPYTAETLYSLPGSES